MLLFLPVFVTSIMLASVGLADTSQHSATVTKMFGKVTILKSPNVSASKVAAPRVKFGDQYYTEVAAERGSEVKLGEVVQTGKVGRARLIFPNGDQINVSTQTTLQVALDNDGNAKQPAMRLSRGKFRAAIDKEGPRSGSKVYTRSMVLGVRGTDFFVANRAGNGLSQVSVIRGEVAVKPVDVEGDEIPVEAGFTAGVGKLDKSQATDPDDINALVVQVAKTPPMLLAQIDNLSNIPGMGGSEFMVASERTPEEIEREKRLRELESKAAKSTLDEIKATDPELYKSLTKDPRSLSDPDKINKKAVKNPKSPAKQKKKPAKKYFFPKK